jgi:hypothetical protein
LLHLSSPLEVLGSLKKGGYSLALKRDSCGEAAIRKIISRWHRDNWIERIDKMHWRKMKAEM